MHMISAIMQGSIQLSIAMIHLWNSCLLATFCTSTVYLYDTEYYSVLCRH